MSQAFHLLANNLPDMKKKQFETFRKVGYRLSGVSATSTAICSSSSRADYIIHSHAKLVSSKHFIKGSSFVSKASSNGRRRNPDFFKQSKHGFSRNRNRENEGRDNFLNIEESDVLSSKNGPLLSLPSGPRSQTPPAPGPKEKEIVELFRKVQAQLRERAAMKEEKRSGSLKGRGKESETVDSLLKLLRKHSAEQGKRSSSNETSSNQLENNGSRDEGKSTSFFRSNTSSKNDFQESSALSNRPVSNFQRKSPVPRVKYQPIYSEETNDDSARRINLNGRTMKNEVEAVPELELEPELESELELEADVIFPDERVINSIVGGSSGIEEEFDDEDEEKQPVDDHKNLSELKLTELRAIAKSRGMKGFSKMKKKELVQLLQGVTG